MREVQTAVERGDAVTVVQYLRRTLPALSQEALARMSGLSQSTIHRAEQGKGLTNPKRARQALDGFGAPRADVSHSCSHSSAAVPPPSSGVPRDPTPIDPTRYPHTLTRGASLGAVAAGHNLPWLAHTAATTDRAQLRIGEAEVGLLSDAALDLDALDQRFGGARLWRPARAHLYWVHHLIEHGTYSDATGRQLHSIAGQLTTSLGWFCYDADQQTEARVYFSEALNVAMLGGDDPLATRTLSNMARQSVDLGKAREAVRFSRLAEVHAAEWHSPPRVRALLAIRQAQGHARSGDRPACEEAIKRSWELFERGVTDRDPDWSSFLNEAELTCLEGMCRSDLGQHTRAIELLTASARLQDVEHSRNRGMCLARLANAALKKQDLDQTAFAAEQALTLVDGGMASSRNFKQLRLVREGLVPLQADRAARQLTDRLDQYIPA
ncbi:helix-turn-helix transcriptional regulator [Nocardiopsis sp. CNT312]|uniref:helix-turn-helix domain-containing protein n=1 Tax=Nocardiopsis sp. CNT312 TaxID=1137268 RepID=UPI0004AF48CE|nr:helix-turn-helix transcriptional regulator [Nocardiopsis sp. CNT312]